MAAVLSVLLVHANMAFIHSMFALHFSEACKTLMLAGFSINFGFFYLFAHVLSLTIDEANLPLLLQGLCLAPLLSCSHVTTIVCAMGQINQV